MRALYTSASFSLTFACLSAASTAVSGSMYSGAAGADGSGVASVGAALVSGFADSSGFVLASGFALSAGAVLSSGLALAVGFALSAGSAEGFAAAAGFADSLGFCVAVGTAVMVGSTASGNIRAQSPVGSLIVASFSPVSTPPKKKNKDQQNDQPCRHTLLFFTVEVVP